MVAMAALMVAMFSVMVAMVAMVLLKRELPVTV